MQESIIDSLLLLPTDNLSLQLLYTRWDINNCCKLRCTIKCLLACFVSLCVWPTLPPNNSFGPFYRLLPFHQLWEENLRIYYEFTKKYSYVFLQLTNQKSLTSLGNKLVIAGTLMQYNALDDIIMPEIVLLIYLFHCVVVYMQFVNGHQSFFIIFELVLQLLTCTK